MGARQSEESPQQPQQAAAAAADPPAQALTPARKQAIEWLDRGNLLPDNSATELVGGREYTQIECFVESILADPTYPDPWGSLWRFLPEEGGTVTIGAYETVYTRAQCLQRCSELQAAEAAAGKK